ncbi:MAG: hypothetical protein L0Y44_02080 [Phycisphaerales bacterium]|nr:hypothetical protein [Phycisphaerales bacterium]
MRSVQRVLMTCWAIAWTLQPAAAQCGSSWVDGPATAVNGVNGPIYASLSWDHDNIPATPNWLVVGGEFLHAGGMPAYNIAAWDGARWHAFGTGTDWPVRALAVYEGQLVIGGSFTLADNVSANAIARWTGSTFQSFGSGMSGGVPYTDVSALLVINNDLYAGGDFTHAGGAPAGNVAWWSGAAWSSMGGGLPGEVNTLQPYVFGFVVAGGHFDAPGGDPNERVALFDGSSWQGLGGGFPNYAYPPPYGYLSFNSYVKSLFWFNGDLHASGKWVRCGDNQWACPPEPGTVLKTLARLDGDVWTDSLDFDVPVGAMANYNGDLIVADGVITALTHLIWQPLGGGVNGDVHSLSVHNGDLYVCGDFTTAGGENGISTSNIARWNGSAWSQIVPEVSVRAMASLPSTASLVAGGNFNWGWGTLNYIALYNDENLSDIGSGALNGTVHAAVVNGSQLIIGGEFVFPGSGHELVNRIAQLDFVGDWAPMGDGFNDTVYALTSHNGSIYAAGAFTASGGTTIDRIARWQNDFPTGTWQPLADGGLNGPVYALASHGGFLFAGGTFTNAGGSAAAYVAKWNGSNWSKLGAAQQQGDQLNANGPGSGVYALASYNNVLRIGGRFLYSNELVSATNLIGWNGGFCCGGGANDTIRALALHNGSLYVGGDFGLIGGLFATGIASWNSTDGWQPLGSGVTGSVHAMQSYNGRLHVGGTFTFAGGLNSPYWAIWEDNAAPAIAQQPQDESVACGETATFSVVPVSGPDPPTYQWRHNGAAPPDGPQPNGSTISGATTATLTITNSGNANIGDYDVVLSNACGSVTSNVATLTVFGCIITCPADIAPQPAGDGVVNVNDLLAVIAAWGACAGCQADLNADGVVNVDDLLAVISAWGPCP